MATDKPQLAAPSLPWKTRITLAVLSIVTDATCCSDGTVYRRLLNLLDFKSPPNSKPINGVKTADIKVDSSPSRNLWFRLFIPTTSQNSDDDLPVIVFFHGGGFVYLSANNFAYDAVCRRLARKVPAIVISVNYRLAPEHKYPAQYDDGFDVLTFLDEYESRSGLPGNADLSRCFLAGDSAGANLAHHVARRACQTKFQQLKVIGLVSIQPFFGGEERTESERKYLAGSYLSTAKRTDWLWKVFLPAREDGCDRDHWAINVSGPRAFDISTLDFPAAMVVVSGFDALKDWQMRYYDWLKRSGKEAYLVEYPMMVHAFYVFPELPESRHLISQVEEFIHKQCSLVAKS